MLGLLRSFVTFADTANIHFWLAHGTLLGWYWGGSFLPWDTDIDLQASLSNLLEFAAAHNGTIFSYPGGHEARNYTLDINTFIADRSLSDTANVIDARWIDMSNGKFIDITGVQELDNVYLQAKDGHTYTVSSHQAH